MEINTIFQSYYSDLFTSESPKDSCVMQDYFSNLEIHTIIPNQKSEIEKSIQHTEIMHAINSVQRVTFLVATLLNFLKIDHSCPFTL